MRYFLLLTVLLATPQLEARSTAPRKIYTAAQLPELLKKAKTDSALYEERAAAMLFHKLINNYRREKKTDTLAWNDTLWLASRNHCVWMMEKNELTHHQAKGTPMFTGFSPGDRYNYVVNNKGRHSWSGENALYNFSHNYASMKTRIKMIAEKSFDQWKNSPGHNENMLNKGSAVHGVAFVIDEENDRTWGVDLFARRPYGEALPVNKSNEEFTKQETVTPADKTPTATVQKFNATKSRTKLYELLYADRKKYKDEVIAEAAAKHARYLASTNSEGHRQEKGKMYYTGKDAKQRVRAAASGLDKIRYRKLNINESVAYMEVPAAGFNEKELAEAIRTMWENDSQGTDATRVGVGLEVKRVKDKVKIWAVRVEGI
jgi:uncharacterized protein YkwD